MAIRLTAGVRTIPDIVVTKNSPSALIRSTPASFKQAGAAEVELSSAERARVSGKNSALREISNARSYIDVAEDAAAKVYDLVTQLKTISESSDGHLLSPEVAAGRATEADSLLTEISRVVNNAEFADQSVVNAGPRQFTFSIDGAVNDPSKTFSVTVPDVTLSRSSLGLSSLSGATITSASTSSDALDTISAAKQIVATNQAALSSAGTDLELFATRFGLKSRAETEIGQRTLEAGQASGVQISAESLRTPVSNQPADELLSTNNLDPLRVEALIADNHDEAA